MRKYLGERIESQLNKCNSIAQIRTAVEQTPQVANEITDSINPVKTLLSDVI